MSLQDDKPLFPAMESSIEEIVQKRTAELQRKYNEALLDHRREVDRLLKHIEIITTNALKGSLTLWLIMGKSDVFYGVSNDLFLTKEDAEKGVPAWRDRILRGVLAISPELMPKFSVLPVEVKL